MPLEMPKKRSRTGLVKLDGMKGFPEQVRPSIRCLEKVRHRRPFSARRRLLKDCFIKNVVPLSPSPHPKPENVISAQALPTLRSLGFIRGRRENVRMTPRGRKAALIDDQEEFDRLVAVRLVKVDSERWFIIEALESTEERPGARVPLPELVIELAKLGIDANESFRELTQKHQVEFDLLGIDWRGMKDRLSSALKYFAYYEIIISQKGYVRLWHPTLVELRLALQEAKPRTVSTKEFFKVLLDVYEERKKELGTSYVPIVNDIMLEVCARLEILEEHFRRMLGELPTSFEGHQLLFSPPMETKPRNLLMVRRGRYSYYLSIFRQARANPSGDA